MKIMALLAIFAVWKSFFTRFAVLPMYLLWREAPVAWMNVLPHLLAIHSDSFVLPFPAMIFQLAMLLNHNNKT